MRKSITSYTASVFLTLLLIVIAGIFIAGWVCVAKAVELKNDEQYIVRLFNVATGLVIMESRADDGKAMFLLDTRGIPEDVFDFELYDNEHAGFRYLGSRNLIEITANAVEPVTYVNIRLTYNSFTVDASECPLYKEGAYIISDVSKANFNGEITFSIEILGNYEIGENTHFTINGSAERVEYDNGYFTVKNVISNPQIAIADLLPVKDGGECGGSDNPGNPENPDKPGNGGEDGNIDEPKGIIVVSADNIIWRADEQMPALRIRFNGLNCEVYKETGVPCSECVPEMPRLLESDIPVEPGPSRMVKLYGGVAVNYELVHEEFMLWLMPPLFTGGEPDDFPTAALLIALGGAVVIAVCGVILYNRKKKPKKKKDT